jgi:hypothetical protein
VKKWPASRTEGVASEVYATAEDREERVANGVRRTLEEQGVVAGGRWRWRNEGRGEEKSECWRRWVKE